ncbi:MYG1 family protein [Noviherbaspirillum galbum]|uniref:MYG1 family protein n=1 Tax=Noviherbaspirillum galbum TaxID=2709383 RepID=A0A6B3SR80_9BURK|nr:MYG1 family protein [Noviherbaspirillum galbum]NEX63277.1 MYG1 family protein [Noviherbaspirillum galbum]
MIIATHSGKFHADDVWAVVVLDLLHPGCELVRTRDPERIRQADFAVDVGGIWDPASGRFDHHQKGFSGARPSGVVYASAGLVWREHGARCVRHIARTLCGHALGDKEAQEMAYAIDNDLVQYLDMADTGAARNAPGGYGLSAVISGFNPTWLDEKGLAPDAGAEAMEAMRMQRFRRAMDVIADVLVNQVRYRVGSMLALDEVRASERLEKGRLLFLKNAALPWAAVVRNEMPKVVFVLSYSPAEQRHLLHTIPKSSESFEARKDLPASWAGLQGADLAAVTGVEDAVFCHNNLFIAAAVSFEGALRMARQALD